MTNQNQQFRYRGYDAEVQTDGDGQITVTVDDQSVPIRIVGGKFVVTYHEPQDDAVTAVKQYINRLVRK